MAVSILSSPTYLVKNAAAFSLCRSSMIAPGASAWYVTIERLEHLVVVGVVRLDLLCQAVKHISSLRRLRTSRSRGNGRAFLKVTAWVCRRRLGMPTSSSQAYIINSSTQNVTVKRRWESSSKSHC
jgi:hypothetical protein